MTNVNYCGCLRAVGVVLFLVFARVAIADPPPPAAQENPISAEYREYKWSNGDQPVKMLAKEQGFCFLSEVGGHFAGGGEVIRVYIGDDGFWYLGGTSGQPDLWGKAMSVKFTHKLKAAMALPDDPNTALWATELAKLTTTDDASIKDLAAREQTGLPQEREKLIARAAEWDEPTRKLPVEQRRIIESHIIRLCDLSLADLTGSELDVATAKTNALRLALANRQLNDLDEWTKRHGEWSQKDGKIEGRGDSYIEFKQKLPSDCLIEWRMNVADGMRPRLLFLGTDAFVANEGFEHVIDLYSIENYRGLSTPYANGDNLKIGVKCLGKSVELYVNDELMVKGNRRLDPRMMGLAIRGGDDWSPGTTTFWDFKVTPVK